MASTGNEPGLSPITPAQRAQEMAEVAKVLAGPFAQDTMDKFVSASPERSSIFTDAFWGRIRWPKSVGRSLGPTLADGFTITLRNHFTLYYAGAGGEVITKEGYMEMPTPVVTDLGDDSDHYKVVFSGYYARLGLVVDRNELRVTINGSWTNPEALTGRYLLVDPYGFNFGTHDDSPIVLDEMTVVQHWTPNHPRFAEPLRR
jgi:hypothetical protein